MSSDARAGARSRVIRGAARRVLVVDDDELTVRSLAKLLSRDGAHVMTAISAGQALAAAGSFPRDYLSAVVLDLHLSDGDGVDVAARLRPIVGNTCRLILLTGDHSLATLRRCAGEDATGHPIIDAFLGKPVNLDALRQAIEGDG